MSSKTGKLWWIKTWIEDKRKSANGSLWAPYRVEKPDSTTSVGPQVNHPDAPNTPTIWLVKDQADWNITVKDTVMRLKPAEVDDLLTWAGLREEVTHGDASQ